MSEVLNIRYNIVNIESIRTFANIKGTVNNNCKDVSFVRAIGTNASYANEIKALDEVLFQCMKAGKGFYYRLSGLKRLQAEQDIQFYSTCYAKWVESGKQEMITRLMPLNTKLSKTLGSACATIEKLYNQGSVQATESILKNLIVKMLFWFDAVFSGKEFVWDETKSIKIVASNVEKKQEYLFFYLLTLVGCDVLLLQSAKDIGAEEEKLNLSVKFELGAFSEITIPEYNEALLEQQKERGETAISVRMNISENINTKMSINPANSENKIRIQIPKRERSNSRQAAVNAAQTNAQTSVNKPMETQTSVPSATKPKVVSAQHPNRENNPAEKSFEELARLASSVVLIVVHDEKGEVIGGGSGIMIGKDGYILTNCHVACRGKSYSIRIEEDENVYQTDEFIKYNQMLDLAVLRIDKKLNPLPIYKGPKELVRGQKVVAIGSPLGLFNSVSDGIISGFRKFEHGDMIQFTAPISDGSSGGALLNMQGEVIGISTAGFNDGQNLNLAMGYESINPFIRGFV